MHTAYSQQTGGKNKQLIRGFLNHCYIYDASFAGATMVKDNHYNYQYSKIHIFPYVIDLGLSVFLWLYKRPVKVFHTCLAHACSKNKSNAVNFFLKHS